MKKIYIIIIIILTLGIIGQFIYFNLNKKEGITTSDNLNESYEYIKAGNLIDKDTGNEIEISNKDNVIYPRGTTEIYKKYNGTVPMEKMEQILYNFLNTDIPQIQNYTANKTSDEIQKIYEDNEEKINDMCIYSADEFEKISDQINKLGFDDTFIYSKCYAYEDTYKEIDKYARFKITIIFKNNSSLDFMVYLTTVSNEKSVKISNYEAMDVVYDKYNGDISEDEVITKLNKFIESDIKTIKDETIKISGNKRLQYYDLNKDTVQDMLIYSAEDFKNVSIQIENISWNKNPQYVSREVETDTIKTESNYLTFKMNLKYSTNQEISLKIYIAMSINTEPNIKIATDIK